MWKIRVGQPRNFWCVVVETGWETWAEPWCLPPEKMGRDDTFPRLLFTGILQLNWV